VRVKPGVLGVRGSVSLSELGGALLVGEPPPPTVAGAVEVITAGKVSVGSEGPSEGRVEEDAIQ